MKQINTPDAKRIKNKTKLEEHLYLCRAETMTPKVWGWQDLYVKHMPCLGNKSQNTTSWSMP